MPAPWADAGSAPYNNITETDPMISDPENFDFRLKADSPAKGYGCETFYIPEGTKCKEEIIYSSKLTGGNISIGARIIENTIVKADTVNIYENIVIENNAALNILPGTVMLFHGPYNITVEGTLIAEGTAEERVIFTSFEPDPYNDFTSNKSSWRGIIFDKTLSTNDSSIFRYCVFEYAKSISEAMDRPSDYSGGAMFFNNFAKIKIENCIFRYNTAIYGAAISLFNNSNLSINNSLFYENYAKNNGSVLCVINSSPFIYNNTMTDNKLSAYDGNYQPGAIFTFRSKPFLANNIIRRSHTYASPQVHYAKPQFTFSNNIGGITGYNGNIDDDPAFLGSQIFPGILSEDSPCIDNGGEFDLEQPQFDLIGNPRVSNGTIDMGAFEFQPENSISSVPEKIQMLQIYPNPANPSARITFQAKEASKAEILIYDTSGKLACKFTYANAVKGSNSYDLRSEKLSAGLYVIKVVTPGLISQGKLLLLK
ncbi:TPA: hypothetical protein DCR49_09010 [Candidatus Delongbacteria bacterium]|nr:hypothetical protein [Candidatus Delongbacteria bacterium]